VDHWLPEYLSPKGIVLSAPVAHLLPRFGYDIYVPANGTLNRTKPFGECSPVRPAYDEKIDIALEFGRTRRMGLVSR
jgi:hypothetical protein